MNSGCKGCSGPNGPSACPVHGGSNNDLVCGTCGYRGPAEGHGACSADPVTLARRYGARIGKLELRMDAVEREMGIKAETAAAAAKAPVHSPVEDGEFGTVLSDVVSAWRRSKVANSKYERHINDVDPPQAVLEEKTAAGKALSEVLDRLDKMCVR